MAKLLAVLSMITIFGGCSSKKTSSKCLKTRGAGHYTSRGLELYAAKINTCENSVVKKIYSDVIKTKSKSQLKASLKKWSDLISQHPNAQKKLFKMAGLSSPLGSKRTFKNLKAIHLGLASWYGLRRPSPHKVVWSLNPLGTQITAMNGDEFVVFESKFSPVKLNSWLQGQRRKVKRKSQRKQFVEQGAKILKKSRKELLENLGEEIITQAKSGMVLFNSTLETPSNKIYKKRQTKKFIQSWKGQFKQNSALARASKSAYLVGGMNALKVNQANKTQVNIPQGLLFVPQFWNNKKEESSNTNNSLRE